MYINAMIFMQKGVQETLVSTDILRFVLWVGSVLHQPNSKHFFYGMELHSRSYECTLYPTIYYY